MAFGILLGVIEGVLQAGFKFDVMGCFFSFFLFFPFLGVFCRILLAVSGWLEVRLSVVPSEWRVYYILMLNSSLVTLLFKNDISKVQI